MSARQSQQVLDFFRNECKGDIAGAFGALAEAGVIELMTTAATHAFLPALAPVPRMVRAQIRGGRELFRQRFGYEPAGQWLPECGYFEGLDELLHDEGVSYFILEHHGLNQSGIFHRRAPRLAFPQHITREVGEDQAPCGAEEEPEHRLDRT